LTIETAALGFSHTLVIEKATCVVFAFGSNERGQVTGTASSAGSTKKATPTTPLFLSNTKAIAVAAGLFHSAVITEEGELVMFGCDQFGQSLSKSDGEMAGRWSPSDGARLVAIACGRRHTITADDRGRIWTMGENKYGQLGRSTGGDKFDATPTLVEGIRLGKIFHHQRSCSRTSKSLR